MSALQSRRPSDAPPDVHSCLSDCPWNKRHIAGVDGIRRKGDVGLIRLEKWSFVAVRVGFNRDRPPIGLRKFPGNQFQFVLSDPTQLAFQKSLAEGTKQRCDLLTGLQKLDVGFVDDEDRLHETWIPETSEYCVRLEISAYIRSIKRSVLPSGQLIIFVEILWNVRRGKQFARSLGSNHKLLNLVFHHGELSFGRSNLGDCFSQLASGIEVGCTLEFVSRSVRFEPLQASSNLFLLEQELRVFDGGDGLSGLHLITRLITNLLQ